MLQIRALSGTEVRVLDHEQRSVNSSLEEKDPEPQQVQNPNISDCASIVPVQFMKDYKASAFMILESHWGLHVCLTDKIPLMLHLISVFNRLSVFNRNWAL